MKVFTVSVLLILSNLNILKAQDDIPLIDRKKVLLQDQYYILGERVSTRRVVKLMLGNNEAHRLMKSSRRLNFAAATLVGIGFGGICSQLLSLEDDEGFNFAIAGFSTGLIVGAVALSFKSDKNADKAIELYNGRQLTSRDTYSKYLTLSLDGNGLGLKLVF